MEEVEKELFPVASLRDSLEQTERGNPKGNVPNVVKILREDPLLAGAIRLNELSEKVDIVRDLGWHRDDAPLTDTDIAYITLYLDENYGIGNQKSIETAIRVIATENRYHPIRDILNSLEWDGVPRVENMLTHFFGAEKTELVTESMKLFMLGAVSRVFRPGIKFETALCLVGDQGAGKSTFFRFLAIRDDYFSDDLKNLNDDKIAARLQGHWIMEMPEMLATLNAKLVEVIKCFISRDKDNYRTPYDRHARDRKRQCVFGGTSNKLEILPMDKSGNRRIIPIETHMRDAEVHILDNEKESRAYILQAWAEIMEIYRSGDYSLTLPKHLKEELAQYQDRFTPEDDEKEAVEEFLTTTREKYVCISMLAYEALGYSDFNQPRKSDRNRIAEIMYHISGWEPAGVQRCGKYGSCRAWKRVEDKTIADGFIEVTEQMELPFD